jgi:hypothetical protein
LARSNAKLCEDATLLLDGRRLEREEIFELES